jgi:hypothetical protein
MMPHRLHFVKDLPLNVRETGVSFADLNTTPPICQRKRYFCYTLAFANC